MKDWDEILEILEDVIKEGNYIGGLNTSDVNGIFDVLNEHVNKLKESGNVE